MIRTLNGDILEVSDASEASDASDASEVLKKVARHFQVSARRVRIVPDAPEASDTYFAYVEPLSIRFTFVELQRVAWHKCTHPDLVEWVLSNYHDTADWLYSVWGNPHPDIVRLLIARAEETPNGGRMRQYANENPHDDMIDFVVARAAWWRPALMCNNSSVRAQRLCIAHFEANPDDMVYQKLKHSTDPEVFAWAIRHHPIPEAGIGFVAKNAHLLPQLGELLLTHFDTMNWHLGTCTDARVIRRFIDHVLEHPLNTTPSDSMSVPHNLCANPLPEAVEWLLKLTHTTNLSFAVNPHPDAVDMWLQRVSTGEFETNHSFWYQFGHNPNERAVDATVEWLERRDERRWFCEHLCASIPNANPRLILEMYDRWGEGEFPTNWIVYALTFSDHRYDVHTHAVRVDVDVR